MKLGICQNVKYQGTQNSHTKSSIYITYIPTFGLTVSILDSMSIAGLKQIEKSSTAVLYVLPLI